MGRDSNKLEVIAATLDIPTLIASGSITDEADVKSIFTKAVEKFGTVDVVINTAGGMDPNSLIGEVEPTKWWDDFVGFFLSRLKQRFSNADMYPGGPRQRNIQPNSPLHQNHKWKGYFHQPR